MKYTFAAVVALVSIGGCEARRPARPAPAQKAAKLAKALKHAEQAIDKAKQDPDVTPQELAVIIVLENARQSLMTTEITLSDDLTGSVHPMGHPLQSELLTLLIEALDESLAENERHHEVCVKTARECEDEFPEHAKSLRTVARKLARANRITDLHLHKLRKAR